VKNNNFDFSNIQDSRNSEVLEKAKQMKVEKQYQEFASITST
jgi:hypothetical protein